MQVVWTQGSDESVMVEGHTGLATALRRRGLSLVAGDVQAPCEGIVLVGAPRRVLGPERVRAWREQAEKGSHILVFGRGSDLEASDVGMALPGLQVSEVELREWRFEDPVPWEDAALPMDLSGPRALVTGRGSARIIAPDGAVPGRLDPKGRGWFRFARTWDVSHAWGCADGWTFVRLRIGQGSLGLFADPGLLSDERLVQRDHRRLLSRLLDAWLPSLHALHAASSSEAGQPPRSPWVPRLQRGCDPLSVFQSGGPISAMRALAEAGLVETVDGVLHLSDSGRAQLHRVHRVLELERWFAAGDLGLADGP